MSLEDRWGASAEAEEAFAEFLSRREVEPELSLHDFSGSRPHLRDELERLHALWVDLADVLEAGADADGEPPELDRHELLEEIGRGGMGIVFSAFDPHLRRTLAMKVIRADRVPRGTGSSARRVERFVEEARITGQLGHPGIVPVHELGQTRDGRAFFTMPRVEGRTLREVFDGVRNGEAGWGVTRAVGVLQRVCETMAFAHSRGVVHRDLKPANVMVGRFGETYVMDWGLARSRAGAESVDIRPRAPEKESPHASGAPELLTVDGDVLGTPAYMPPEQAEGRQAEVDERSDVYAVGAMLYHLLAGEPPFDGGSPSDVLAKVRSGPPRPLHRRRPSPPSELVAISEKAMARDRDLRYPNMASLGEDLRAWLEGRVVRAYESGAVAELKKWLGRNRALARAIAAALVLGLVGVFATLYVRGVEAAKVLRLADLQLLEELDERARSLHPAHPDRLPELRSWLREARELRARLPQHEDSLAELDERAAAAGGEIGDVPARWRHEKLRELVAGLRAFGPEVVDDVQARLDFASSVVERSIDDHRAEWNEALASIADPAACPRYGGLAITEQVGLVPLGRNADTGLWEFAHLASGESPERGPEGALRLAPECGLVFVLVPGDAQLAPFFASKFELTRAQWIRATDTDPEGGSDPDARPLHPAVLVSWNDCARVALELGIALPTERQWWHAATGGTDDPWWTRDPAAAIRRDTNLEQFTPPGEPQVPIGGYPPNPFGLHDVVGNVSEWCRDETEEGHRRYRGGNLFFPAILNGLTLANQEQPDVSAPFLGLRPVRALDP